MTRDPSLNTTPAGKTVCNFTVAVNRRQKRQDGQPDEADFFRVAAWGEMGEACNKYLAKGRKVAVTGAVQVRTYKDNNGEFRANLEIPFAQDVEFLTSKGDGGHGSTGASGDGGQGSTGTSGGGSAAAPASDAYIPTNDDDLPF